MTEPSTNPERGQRRLREDFRRTLTGLSPDRRREVEVARDAAREAARLLMSAAGTVEVRRKPDGTIVTDADRAADRLIRERLMVAFPADEVLTEEAGTEYDGGDRVWIVDPLDGTANFTNGVPLWGVTLALVARGHPVVGVSVFPRLSSVYTAVRGAGAWLGQRRLSTMDRADLGADDLVALCSRTPGRFDLQLVARQRVLGSAALNFALVASGTFRATIAATARIWDLAAGWLIVEEAGGVVETLSGPSPWPLQPDDYGRVAYPTLAAASPSLFRMTRARVRARREDGLSDEALAETSASGRHGRTSSNGAAAG